MSAARFNTPPAGAPYRSIFLAEDWAHQRYFGWRVAYEAEGLRVLRKGVGVLNRYLVLLTRPGLPHLPAQLSRLPGWSELHEIVLHDFDRVLGEDPVIGASRFGKAAKEDRLLNVATVVIDLCDSEETLWRALGTKGRNAVRRAEKLGAVLEEAEDVANALDRFEELSREAVARYGLRYPALSTLAKMAADGRALIYCARTGTRAAANVSVVYVAAGAGFYMHGATAKETVTGLGQFVQWQIVRHLRDRGLCWYDLGGITSKESDDPITRFKRSIGGEFVDLGNEYIFRGTLYRRALMVRSALRTFAEGKPASDIGAAGVPANVPERLE